jgi:hypothetical protein
MVSAVPDGRADLLEQIFAGIDADLNLIRSMRQLKSFRRLQPRVRRTNLIPDSNKTPNPQTTLQKDCLN